MSHIVRTNPSSGTRRRLLRLVCVAANALKTKTCLTTEALDIGAFIVLSLETIWAGIETTTAAWEKRNYWNKADKFRQDWQWIHKFGAIMREELAAGNYWGIFNTASEILGHISTIGDIKTNNTINQEPPWQGAWLALYNKAPKP